MDDTLRKTTFHVSDWKLAFLVKLQILEFLKNSVRNISVKLGLQTQIPDVDLV